MGRGQVPQDTDFVSLQPFQADGWCDTINNRAYCNYDGGDCCSSTLSSKKVSGVTGMGGEAKALEPVGLLLALLHSAS